jgi:hypothetical protein
MIKNFPFINALGISYDKKYHDMIKDYFSNPRSTKQEVIHLIAGLHNVETMERCLEFKRILILGYKKVGRGETNYGQDKVAIDQNLKEWDRRIGEFFNRGALIAFDNLALEQIDVKRFFKDSTWKEMYMGDDGQYTMYLDMVKNEFAISSRSKQKILRNGKSIREMFSIIQTIHKENNEGG